jgi:hypothetical protein
MPSEAKMRVCHCGPNTLCNHCLSSSSRIPCEECPPAPSAPPAEVECNTDYGIEGVGLPPLQCDCHKDGDPRHCSKCINHSWGKAGARPAEVEPHPWYGPCDGFRADGGCSECARVAGAPADPQPEREMTEDEAFAAYWIVTWRSDDGEFIHEGHDAFDTHEAAERYIDSIKDEWTSYDLYRGELIRSGR